MLRTFDNGTIEYFIDRERRIVFGRWRGEFGGDDLMAASPQLWRQHPEIGRFSAIHDVLDFTGIIEHRYARELMRLRAEVFGDIDVQIRTAIVTSDPMKVFELKVTKAEAPENRQFRLFGSNTAALEWVTAVEPGNPSAGGSRSSAPLPWWYHHTAARIDAG